MKALEFIDQIHGVRSNGRGWKARCPAHDDREASLSIHEGDDGRILLKCFAGCETVDIVDALGLAVADLFPERLEPTNGHRSSKRIPYAIQNADGRHVATHIRIERPDGSKAFAWERPDGQSGLGGIPVANLPLYRIDRFDNREIAILCEGEKAKEPLSEIGIPALGTVCGVSSTPGDEALRPLLDVRVVHLWPDNDPQGQDHMRRIAARLHALGHPDIRIMDWADAPPKGDVADFMARGASKDDVRALFKQARRWSPDAEREASRDESEPEKPAGDCPDEKPPKKSQADLLVALASQAALFHDPDGEGYATIPVDGHQETWLLKSKSFRRWLARRFYEAQGNAPGAQAMQDALCVLEGQALFSGPEQSVFTRLAGHEGKIYLDLANEQWRAVEIGPDGWRMVSESPVKFRRAKGMLPIPTPITGGSVDALRPFVNLSTEADWYLYVAWFLAGFRPTGPYPVLCVHGEHGSAKTTLSRVARRLIDPNSAPLRSEPREIRDIMIAATNGWIVGYDNLSRLPDWLSDALCRLSTGGGFSTRELYSDADEVLFEAQRPVALNGIEELATRADLLDRAILVYLPRTPDEQRRTEKAFWQAFDQEQPRILGALLAVVSRALKKLPETELEKLPRMADFALWVTAAEEALGWQPVAFIKAYSQNRRDANDLSLEASPVAEAILAFMSSRQQWSGTPTELVAELNQHADEEKRKPNERNGLWPTSARLLSNALRRLAPNLKVAGIEITFVKIKGTRTVQLEKRENSSPSPSPASPHGENTRQNAKNQGDDEIPS